MKPIEQVRNLITKDLGQLPYFINTSSELSKNTWSYLKFILRIISKLTNDRVLSDTKVSEYNSDVQEAITLMIDGLSDDSYIVDISVYLSACMECYENKALELELYEVCENFKKFKILYYSND